MSFDIAVLRDLIATHGQVARIVVADVKGSAPREVGASVMAWPGGQLGTIGGGALEYEAVRLALGGVDRVDRIALGPRLGQCCGGAVTLVTEIWDAARLNTVSAPVFARGPGDMPLAVRRALTKARHGQGLRPQFLQGWMVEPITAPHRPVWIYGAGHVGRALVEVLRPLPDIAITWVDTTADRFPILHQDVTQKIAPNPAQIVPQAPQEAEHLILTYSHALDLDLCHSILTHGFAWAGLIGSATKWARFRTRLRQLGHSNAQVARICCPIGQPNLGKHPQAIAIGVATALLQTPAVTRTVKERA